VRDILIETRIVVVRLQGTCIWQAVVDRLI